MRMNTKSLLIAWGMSMGVLAAPSLGQVAPPPTEPAPEQPAYTPPPKPEPRVSPQPTRPQPKEGLSARRRTGSDDLPTNVPYPKLAQKGPDGRILRLRQLPDIVAMRSNPNIGPKTVEAIMPIVYARRNHTEIAVIDNIDLYWKLTDGMIANMNMADINEMSQVAEMIKPLVLEVSLSQDLLNRNILSRVQGGMNQYIVREYKKAVTDEIQVLEGEEGLAEVMRFVLYDSLHEARLAYEGMMAELIGQVDEVVEKSGVESEAAENLKDFQKELSDDPVEQFEDLQAFDKEFRKLSYDDAVKILTTMRQSRKFEVISPTIKTIDVLHERKKVMEGDGFNLIVEDATGKRVITHPTGTVEPGESQQPEQQEN